MSRRLTFGDLEEDPEIIFQQCQDVKGIAPVGKKFLSQRQKMMEAVNDYSSLGSLSDLEMSKVESLLSQESVTPHVELENNNVEETIEKTHRRTSQRRSDYFEEEKSLTGEYFNIFKDLPPVFRLLTQDDISIEHTHSISEKEKTGPSTPISSPIVSELSIMKEESSYSDNKTFQIEEERNFDSYNEFFNIPEKKVRFSEDVIQFTISPTETILSSEEGSLKEDIGSAMSAIVKDSVVKEESFSVKSTKRKAPFAIIEPREICTGITDENEKPWNYDRPERNRVLPIRPWLSERTVYETDSKGPAYPYQPSLF
ncbi:unnamed protein product [Auanema sp. JU1783]|nr:unnamed protein product [Auanema sp. JU1783]